MRHRLQRSGCGRRVRVHLLNGTRIGLAGVGEGNERLTFPSHYQVGDGRITVATLDKIRRTFRRSQQMVRAIGIGLCTKSNRV